MTKKFIPHILKKNNDESTFFEPLDCEPVTAKQAAAMLEMTSELMLFVELPSLQRKRHRVTQRKRQSVNA